MMRAITAIVRGRVQGVFFRAHTRAVARRLGVVGWVRNNRDGTVECFAQGLDPDVAELIRFLHEGSPASRVDSVEVREGEPDFSLKDFKVLG